MATQTERRLQKKALLPLQKRKQRSFGHVQLKDHRPAVVAQTKRQRMVNDSNQVHRLRAQQQAIQRRVNPNGLPPQLKAGVESLSGIAMDDVRVHYNSSKPAQLQAHAYAQGTDIHLAPGQEKHLAHEAWHVVQQKQGRVRPTMQLKGKVNINDDAGLEREADVMGTKAIRQRLRSSVITGQGDQTTVTDRVGQLRRHPNPKIFQLQQIIQKKNRNARLSGSGRSALILAQSQDLVQRVVGNRPILDANGKVIQCNGFFQYITNGARQLMGAASFSIPLILQGILTLVDNVRDFYDDRPQPRDARGRFAAPLVRQRNIPRLRQAAQVALIAATAYNLYAAWTEGRAEGVVLSLVIQLTAQLAVFRGLLANGGVPNRVMNFFVASLTFALEALRDRIPEVQTE